MKKILILLTAFCCCGCGSTEIDATQNAPKYYKEMSWVKDGIYSVEVEGHIYIVFDGAYCAILSTQNIVLAKLSSYDNRNKVQPWR